MKILLLAAASLFAEDPLRFELAFKTEGYAQPVFSLDGKTFVATNAVWDVAARRQIGVAPAALIAVSNGAGLGLSVTKKHVKMKSLGKPAGASMEVVRGKADSELVLWDLKTGEKIRTLAEHRFDCMPYELLWQDPMLCPYITASFSPDGKRAVFNVPPAKAPWTEFEDMADGRFRDDVWQAYVTDVDGKPRKLPGEYAAFMPDGRLLVLKFAENKPQQIIDGDTGKTISYVRNAMWGPTIVKFSGGGTRLLVSRHSQRRMNEHEKEMELKKYGWYASYSHYEHMQAWNTETGDLVFDKTEDFNGDLWAAGGGRWLVRTYEDTNVIAKLRQKAFDLDAEAKPHALSFSEKILDISPDGTLAAVAGKDNVTQVMHIRFDGASPADAPKPVALTDVDNPPAAKLPVDPNAYAVVIGVEKYREAGIPKVDFAARDAATVHRYLTESLGFDAANVVLLQDDRATKTDLEKHLGAWLKNRVDEKSRIFVYYAGHGAPNPATGQGFLIPYEGDPNYTDETAYPIQTLYDTLAKLPAKDVTVVLDACFSGSGGRSLLAKGARPLVTQSAAKAGGNTSVISAASGAQVSASYPQGRHGLLTYFLLEGLHGAADADKDGAVTTAELFGYARPAVEREARKQNLEQTPTLAGPGATVWLKK